MIKVGKYCISVKRMNYVVCRNLPKEKVNKSGQKVAQYSIIGYFNSLRSALEKIRSLTIRDGLMKETGDLDEALRKIEKIDADFSALTERLFAKDVNAKAADSDGGLDESGAGMADTGDSDPECDNDPDDDEDDGIVDAEDEDDDETDGNGDILVTVIDG